MMGGDTHSKSLLGKISHAHRLEELRSQLQQFLLDHGGQALQVDGAAELRTKIYS